MKRQFHRQYHNDGHRVTRPKERAPLGHPVGQHEMVVIDEDPSSFGPGLLWRLRELMIQNRVAPCANGSWIFLFNGRRIEIPAPLWMTTRGSKLNAHNTPHQRKQCEKSNTSA